MKLFLRKQTFDNRRFWNRRYAEDPDKGSGPGSRGENAALKCELVRATIKKYGIKTVLDIGCGDIETIRSLEIKSYIGLDISHVVVERNRIIRPEWNFICADLASPYVPHSAELVLCLDVLIHQKKRQAYDAMLSKTLAAAEKVALISGYSQPDGGWNVFYHEAIGDSIQRLCPHVDVHKVAEYRGTDLLQIKK